MGTMKGGVTNMFIILNVMIFSWMYPYAKSNQTIFFKYVQFFICRFSISKAVHFLKMPETFIEWWGPPKIWLSECKVQLARNSFYVGQGFHVYSLEREFPIKNLGLTFLEQSLYALHPIALQSGQIEREKDFPG